MTGTTCTFVHASPYMAIFRDHTMQEKIKKEAVKKDDFPGELT